LPNDRLKSSDSQYWMIGYRNRNRSLGESFLQDDVTASLPDLGEAVTLQDGADFFS